MDFDFKKQYKELYMAKSTPSIVEVPKMNYLAVNGKGNPNKENGEYQNSLGLLYAIGYTLKMSYKSDYKIDGFFEYVMPPLEGFWWQEGIQGVDYLNKDKFCWISLIRLPDFIGKADFDWAIESATKKKKEDFSKVNFFTYDEGMCVQCMHIGAYDNEPITTKTMDDFAKASGYKIDLNDTRHHHEIYLSDPRKVATEKLKTVLRHPIKKIL